MTGHVQQRIDLEYGHALGARRDLHDLIAGLHLAFLQYTEIEAGSPVLDHERGHLGLVHTDAEPVAGDARLRHLE